jgi:hypothetical protein
LQPEGLADAEPARQRHGEQPLQRIAFDSGEECLCLIAVERGHLALLMRGQLDALPGRVANDQLLRNRSADDRPEHHAGIPHGSRADSCGHAAINPGLYARQVRSHNL